MQSNCSSCLHSCRSMFASARKVGALRRMPAPLQVYHKGHLYLGIWHISSSGRKRIPSSKKCGNCPCHCGTKVALYQRHLQQKGLRLVLKALLSLYRNLSQEVNIHQDCTPSDLVIYSSKSHLKLLDVVVIHSTSILRLLFSKNLNHRPHLHRQELLVSTKIAYSCSC